MIDATKLEFYGLRLPIIEFKTDFNKLLFRYFLEANIDLKNNDVLVITSKYVLKAMGLVVNVSKVHPGFRAKLISRFIGKDPVETQIVLDNSQKVLFFSTVGFLSPYIKDLGKEPEKAKRALKETHKSILFTITKNGFISTDSGLDYSNVPEGYAVVNACDFDKIAQEIRSSLNERFNINIAIVITDTEFTLSNGKFGTLDFAVGSSGINVITREFGSLDLYGRPKFGGIDIVVDEISAAAALLMKQTNEGIPAVLVRGLEYERSEEGVKGLLITGYRKTAKKVIFKIIVLTLLAKIFRIL